MSLKTRTTDTPCHWEVLDNRNRIVGRIEANSFTHLVRDNQGQIIGSTKGYLTFREAKTFLEEYFDERPKKTRLDPIQWQVLDRDGTLLGFIETTGTIYTTRLANGATFGQGHLFLAEAQAMFEGLTEEEKKLEREKADPQHPFPKYKLFPSAPSKP